MKEDCRRKMGVDCFGWIEVQNPTEPQKVAFPARWEAIIAIDHIIDRNYDAYGYFFDAVRRDVNAIAGRRGLPWDASHAVALETIDRDGNHYDLPAASWILWS